MPRAAQEGPRPGIPLLEYREFFDLGQLQYGLSPILGPNLIPVHPKVFEASELYTQEFVDDVWISLPDSIRADIAVMESITGIPVPIRVSNWGVTELDREGHPKKRVPFMAFIVEGNPRERQVCVEPLRDGAPDVDMGLDPRNHYLRNRRNYEKIISKSKIRAYALPETRTSEGGLITWYEHNSGMANFATELIFRNFAIQFNNLGLQMLGVV